LKRTWSGSDRPCTPPAPRERSGMAGVGEDVAKVAQPQPTIAANKYICNASSENRGNA